MLPDAIARRLVPTPIEHVQLAAGNLITEGIVISGVQSPQNGRASSLGHLIGSAAVPRYREMACPNSPLELTPLLVQKCMYPTHIEGPQHCHQSINQSIE